MAAKPIPDSVTVTITSCGRLDLLDQTLTAFQSFNSGGRYLISEDSGDPDVIEAVKKRMPQAIVLTGEGRTGLMASLDRLYSAVETPYIFHLEDDWITDAPVDWETAMEALEKPGVAQVCVRAFDEIRAKWRRHSDPLEVNGHHLAHMRANAHVEFFGWSPNPGLFKTELYHRFKPFARVMPDQMSAIIKKDSGQTMAFLLPGIARHIGAGRNVTDPTMPARPKARLAKWARRIKKQLYYWGLRKQPY